MVALALNLALGASLVPFSLGIPTESFQFRPRSAYPFDKIVAFGDEFSDNGNGSFAHGITGNPANVYGFGTWTNGPVAVSYLSTLLSSPLTNFAFGGCCGGGDFGASFDNSYTKSPAGAASLIDQIANYSSTGYADIKESLGFIWVGQNDLSLHTDAFWADDPKNAEFAKNAAAKTSASVKELLDNGAPYVLVANIFPKHLAPVTPTYLCGTSTECVDTWGRVIVSANGAIESSLRQFGDKVIYYDSYSFVKSLLGRAVQEGFTAPLADICDGKSDALFDDCVYKGHAAKYFWMNFLQPTTRVHELIARDMKNFVDEHFGL